MAKNDSKTRAFNTTAKPKSNKKSRKSKKRIRQQVVISIFAVIALILVVFATLIIGKIIMLKKNGAPTPNTPESVYTVSCYAEDVKKGNLLWIDNNKSKYVFSHQPELLNVSNFKTSHIQDTHIEIAGTNYPTYSLNQNSIVLEEKTLIYFNKLMLDFCSNNITSTDIFNSDSASGLQIAWGGYESEEEYNADLIKNIGGYPGIDYVDHALGTNITLRKMPPYSNQVITQALLLQEYEWIYNNAHRYGFIVRYPNSCKDHTGFDSNARIHLRYIGVEHATYIYEKGCCLDKYLEDLRTNYSYKNPLIFEANGQTYNVYYVASSGNPTNVPVPEDKTYYISGDNMNGFIVTVVK